MTSTTAGRRTDEQALLRHRLMPNDIVTEDSAAQQFVELHGDELRYCHSHGKWFRWKAFTGRSTTPTLRHSAPNYRRNSPKTEEEESVTTSSPPLCWWNRTVRQGDRNGAITCDFGIAIRGCWARRTAPSICVSANCDPASPDDRYHQDHDDDANSSRLPRWLHFPVETPVKISEFIRSPQQCASHRLTSITRETRWSSSMVPAATASQSFSTPSPRS